MFLQKLTELFYAWELPLFVVLSMSIQITLVIFGSRRKISAAAFTMVLVWHAYINAESVVNSSLHRLVRNEVEPCKEEEERNHQLRLLWAPFLILHLGTADTITAYSLEDNNLWTRHLFQLVINVGWALYVVIKFWSKQNPLSYLVIPIFVSGVSRNCETVWCLYESASPERVIGLLFRRVLKSPPPKDSYLGEVCEFLDTLTMYFANNVGARERVVDQKITILEKKTPRDAFKLVETELGLRYDSLFTKALLIYSPWGICLRCVYFVSSLATLTSFVIIYKHSEEKGSYYPASDVLITYFLMMVDIVIQIYAVILIAFSDWTSIWLAKHQNGNALRKFLFQNIRTCCKAMLVERRWSRSIKQHNILANCARTVKRRRNPVVFIRKKSGILSGYAVEELKELVFRVIKDSTNTEFVAQVADMKPSEVFHGIVEHVFRKHGCLNKLGKSLIISGFDWSPFRSKIDRSLFIWHIATTLCFYSDRQQIKQYNCKSPTACMDISDYFMYLACNHRKLLPRGRYNSRYNDTKSCILSSSFSGQKRKRATPYKNISVVCEELLEKARSPGHQEPSSSSSLQGAAAAATVTQGVGVAVSLQRIEERWEIISEVWALMLLYAASQIRWEDHAQHLRLGGEFITHVAVLMVHASIADQQTESDERLAAKKKEWEDGDFSKLEEEEH